MKFAWGQKMNRETMPLTTLPLTEIWREACRHIELDISLRNLAGLLEASLGRVSLQVHLVDINRGIIDKLADSAGSELVPWRQILEPVQTGALGNWIADRRMVPFDSCVRQLPFLRSMFAGGVSCIGGLACEHGTRGLFLLSTPSSAILDFDALATLLDPIAAALENHQRLHELMQLREAADIERDRLLERLGRDDDDRVVGHDAGLVEVMARVQQVRAADLPVLLLGETGSGKEVVAREIHTGSPRAGRPFIRVNCGAIAEELIDSELFGHERGSFTGASARRRGWFERADGGTLFLDEIGELPGAAQVRLLRVLQDGLFHRVGGEEVVHVDVRVVAATHRDLPTMVQEGRFRADLWYRIAVFPIVIPPLRERPQDIPALAVHFTRRAAARFGLRLRLPGAAELALLTAYPWPGNIREFAAVIDRATILGNGERLEIEMALGFAAPMMPDAPARPSSSAPLEVTARSASSGPLPTLSQMQKEHIERALGVARGRIEGRGGAAAILDINPHTLRAKMRKLGIEWQRFRHAD